MADERAKSGARCHPQDEQLERVWPAYDHQIRLVALHLARATARMGQAVDRDCTAQNKRRIRGSGQRAKPDAPTRMEKVWLEAIAAVDDDEDPLPNRHRLWEAKVFRPGHASSAGDELSTVTYCSRCGAYATEVPRSLIGTCRGGNLIGGRTQLARLMSGRYPHAGPRTRDLRVSVPRPVTDAELLEKIPKAELRQMNFETPVAPLMVDGPPLHEAMTAVGLTMEGVERYHRWQADRRRQRGNPASRDGLHEDVTGLGIDIDLDNQDDNRAR